MWSKCKEVSARPQFEGVRNAAPMRRRMRTSKNDAGQSNKLMIRQALGYAKIRVQVAAIVTAEETQLKANRMRYIESMDRTYSLSSANDDHADCL